MPAGGLVVKRRLADAALMEMRLNERKQQNEHNQKKGIVNREIIPHLHRNVYPKRRFWVHIAETCTRKGGFGYILAGAVEIQSFLYKESSDEYIRMVY